MAISKNTSKKDEAITQMGGPTNTTPKYTFYKKIPYFF